MALRTRVTVVCALLLVNVIAFAQSVPQITLGTDRITASGVTPNGEVVFFARSVTYRGGVPLLERHAFVASDADGDGVVTHTLETVPRYSVWVAVDAESGAYTVRTAAGTEPVLIALPAGSWRENDGGADVPRAWVDFLLVRPKKGAWVLDVMQGGARDDDGQNDASLRLRTSAMQPLLGKDAPPPQAKKDVLVLIEPRTLDVSIVAAQ